MPDLRRTGASPGAAINNPNVMIVTAVTKSDRSSPTDCLSYTVNFNVVAINASIILSHNRYVWYSLSQTRARARTTARKHLRVHSSNTKTSHFYNNFTSISHSCSSNHKSEFAAALRSERFHTFIFIPSYVRQWTSLIISAPCTEAEAFPYIFCLRHSLPLLL